MTDPHRDYARQVSDWWLERKDQWNINPVPLIAGGIPKHECPTIFPGTHLQMPSWPIESAFCSIRRGWSYIDTEMEAEISALRYYNGSIEQADKFREKIKGMVKRPEIDSERPMRITEEILRLSRRNEMHLIYRSLFNEYLGYIRDISRVNNEDLKNFRAYEGGGANDDNTHNELVRKAAIAFNRLDWEKYLSDETGQEFGGSARVSIRLEGGEFEHTIQPDIEIVKFNPGEYTWESVIGLDDAKAQIAKYFLLPQVNPSVAKYMGDGYEGMVLIGPGGTGKTLLAQTTAAQIDSTFIEVRSVESMWRGESEKNMKDLFSLARRRLHHMQSHVILYFSEIDKILTGKDTQGFGQKMRSVLKAEIGATQTNLVTKANGSIARLYVMGDTNQEDVTQLDEALFRPGRLLAVKVGLPTVKDLGKIWELYLGKYRMSDDVNTGRLAQMSNGLTGADIYKGILQEKVSNRIFQRIMSGRSLTPWNVEQLKGIDPKIDERFLLTQALLEEVLKEYRGAKGVGKEGAMFA